METHPTPWVYQVKTEQRFSSTTGEAMTPSVWHEVRDGADHLVVLISNYNSQAPALARLISAAPDLQRAVECLLSHGTPDDLAECLNIAQNALVKVRGEV